MLANSDFSSLRLNRNEKIAKSEYNILNNF